MPEQVKHFKVPNKPAHSDSFKKNVLKAQVRNLVPLTLIIHELKEGLKAEEKVWPAYNG